MHLCDPIHEWYALWKPNLYKWNYTYAAFWIERAKDGEEKPHIQFRSLLKLNRLIIKLQFWPQTEQTFYRFLCILYSIFNWMNSFQSTLWSAIIQIRLVIQRFSEFWSNDFNLAIKIRSVRNSKFSTAMHFTKYLIKFCFDFFQYIWVSFENEFQWMQ